MNTNRKNDTAPLVILRKNNSLVDFNKKEDNHRSSVLIIDYKNNYSFHIKDDKNFFSKFTRNLEALKKLRNDQKEKVFLSEKKLLRSNLTSEDDLNENHKVKIDNDEISTQNKEQSKNFNSFNIPGNHVSKDLNIKTFKRVLRPPDLKELSSEVETKHEQKKKEGKSENFREIRSNKNSEIINLRENIIDYNSNFFKKIKTDINMMKSFRNMEMDMINDKDLSPSMEEVSKDKIYKSIDISVEKRDYHTENKITNPRTNQELLDNTFLDNKFNDIKKVNDVENKLRYTDNLTVSERKSSLLYRICLICDNYIIIQSLFVPSCGHVFCIKCLKSFLEDKIEQGEVNLKCPILKCTIKVMMETLRLIVSEKHYENIKNKPAIIHSNDDFPKSPRFKSLNLNQTAFDTVKVYLKKHVIQINSSESMFLFTKNKDHFCIYCYEPTLFGKNGNKYVKCLNCLSSTCKFCLKKYTSDHFNKTNPNHCRVYFRTKYKQTIIKESYPALFFHLIFIHIVSYLFLFCGVFYIVKCLLETILNLEEENSGILLFMKNIVFYSLLVCYLAVHLILFVFLIPFFPVFLSIFNN